MDKTSGIYKLMEGSLSANWDFDWAKLNVPALVMTGHLDKVFRIPEDIDQISSSIPKVERLELPNYGHLIPNEAPELFSTEICDFVPILAFIILKIQQASTPSRHPLGRFLRGGL